MKKLLMSKEFIGAIAFAGDLSMGQPVEHSPRVAVLAVKLAQIMDLSESQCVGIARLALLRWAGCTANARDFSDLLGDDIRGRAELLADRNPFVAHAPPAAGLSDYMPSLANMHCEAMAEIARRAGFNNEQTEDQGNVSSLQISIDDLFENWDGSGYPKGRRGEQVDPLAQIVAVVSDIEIFNRQYGLERALELVASRSGKIYQPILARHIVEYAPQWLKVIDKSDTLELALEMAALPSSEFDKDLDSIVSLFSDYAALKQPETILVSRLAADISQQTAERLGLNKDTVGVIKRAAMLHRLGFVGVSNGALSGQTQDENVRLAPYWTERILTRAPSLSAEARLASLAFERLDGSGQYRNLTASSISLEARILQVCVTYAELSITHIGDTQPKHIHLKQMVTQLNEQASAGKLDVRVTHAVCAIIEGLPVLDTSSAEAVVRLTTREQDVLGLLIQGLSNKEIARDLKIAPKTVGTHLDKIYRKLSVSGRTAATMKALEYGLI